MSYGYDAAGRMDAISENGKLVVANVYYPDNRVDSQTRADGARSKFAYVVAGGSVTETTMLSPNGAQTKWRFYDDAGVYRNGHVANITTPDGKTEYEREPGTNLVKSITDPLGRVSTYTYHANGMTWTKTDAIGNTTRYEYDNPCSKVSKITDALGKETTFAYNFAPDSCRILRAEMRDPLQHLTVIDYNGNGMPGMGGDAPEILRNFFSGKDNRYIGGGSCHRIFLWQPFPYA